MNLISGEWNPTVCVVLHKRINNKLRLFNVDSSDKNLLVITF